MTRILHVAAAQIKTGKDISETISRVERQAKIASLVGADVLLFSECALHGYDYEMTPESVRLLAQPATGPDCQRVMELAERYRLSVLIGFYEAVGEQVFNSVLIAHPGGAHQVQRKHFLAPCDENAHISSGDRMRLAFEIKDVRCAIVICADAGIDGLHEDLRQQGVEFRFCPTGGGGQISDMLHEEEFTQSDVQRKYSEARSHVFRPEALLEIADCPYTGFASANSLGPAGQTTCHQGHCMIVDNRRIMRAQIPGTIVLEHMQDQLIHSKLTFCM